MGGESPNACLPSDPAPLHLKAVDALRSDDHEVSLAHRLRAWPANPTEWSTVHVSSQTGFQSTEESDLGSTGGCRAWSAWNHSGQGFSIQPSKYPRVGSSGMPVIMPLSKKTFISSQLVSGRRNSRVAGPEIQGVCAPGSRPRCTRGRPNTRRIYGQHRASPAGAFRVGFAKSPRRDFLRSHLSPCRSRRRQIRHHVDPLPESGG